MLANIDAPSSYHKTQNKNKRNATNIRIQLQSMKRFFTASRYLAVMLPFIASVVVVQAQDDPDADDRLVDIGFVVDVTGSFSDDIAAFKSEAAAIVSDVTASFPNALFGLATFQDYPLNGWGSATNVPHARVSDLVPGDAAFLAAVNSLSASGGGDFPESQLESLYQCITGAGHVAPTAIGGGFSIPSGLNFNFRPGSARILILWTDATFHDPINTPDYPGPTMAQVIQAALTGGSGTVPRRRHLQGSGRRLQEDFGPEAVRVVGIASTNAPTVLAAIAEIATATGAMAGPGGLDCDGDGTIDVTEGSAIICPFAGGLTAAIESIVEAVVPTIPVPVSSMPSVAPSFLSSPRPSAAPSAAPVVLLDNTTSLAPSQELSAAPSSMPATTPDDDDENCAGGGGLASLIGCLWDFILDWFKSMS